MENKGTSVTRREFKINQKVKAILVGVSDYSALEGVVNLPLSKNDIDLMGMRDKRPA